MPGAIWQGEHGARLMARYDIVCVHTIVGYAPAHAAHFSVRGDGTVLQSRDTRYQSGANLEGNPRVIAIENEDHGPHFPTWSGSNVPALTPAQVAANAQIFRWAHETHGVPLRLCPNSLPGSRGLAYHRQGCDGNFTDGWPGRVPGGETWTTSFGKVCPGTRRISQLPDILQRATGAPQPTLEPSELDMFIVRATHNGAIALGGPGYWHHVNGAEWGAMRKAGAPDPKPLSHAEYDRLRAACLQGERCPTDARN